MSNHGNSILPLVKRGVVCIFECTKYYNAEKLFKVCAGVTRSYAPIRSPHISKLEISIITAEAIQYAVNDHPLPTDLFSRGNMLHNRILISESWNKY